MRGGQVRYLNGSLRGLVLTLRAIPVVVSGLPVSQFSGLFGSTQPFVSKAAKNFRLFLQLGATPTKGGWL
jgi:hypothetical protein